MTSPTGLASLEVDLKRQFELLNLPPKPWLPQVRGPQDAPVLDVAIIGAGLCGLAANTALWMEGISNVRLFDRAPQGREGPWITYARMETLRTSKETAGPAMGVPALTFRAWFEAQWGTQAWQDMGLAPRPMWMDYMLWYRQVTNADIVNDCDVTAITPIATPNGMLMRLTTTTGSYYARRVVIATGLDAIGAPRLPAAAQGIAKGLVYHSADEFDEATLTGKRVVVVGAGASAMDNAAAALEAGCARMDLMVRRPKIPTVDKFSGTSSRGMAAGFVALPDSTKWAIMDAGDHAPVPPPKHSVKRVIRHQNAHLHVNASVDKVEEINGALRITTPHRVIEADVAIFATGFGVAMEERPELATFAPHIRTWGDVMGPQTAATNPSLASYPYLDVDFTFTEKVAGTCPALAHVTCFAFAATPTHGKVTSGIPSSTEGARRLATGLTRSLFAEDAEIHLARFNDYETPDMPDNIWLPDSPAC
ncbi:Predicted flavoprotein CzcO associated with the cation diffusion facilitator CzcD [Monaibacterium marinum]|uniref:Predicted flavoprotein CzcO associated with the cation diffusion facilitator CzcD n=1 Tax=Pontivivens marinum TaxID=1690039 RepID=A0A2C9CQV6_9RHOB|nr:NAD(P)/FAD-dependent oxidoreductase [Monaibacterium marinum]SOH93931.1 Predicted flavoprotein CzcO associated with the cation diffusion facilitator CzcD [Monaibacterium marinum]